MDDLQEKITETNIEVAVLKERVVVLDEKIDTIANNHLAHIAADVKQIIKVQGEHSLKFVEYDLAKKIIFAAVGFITMSFLVGWVQYALKGFHN